MDLKNREFEYAQYLNEVSDEETWLAYRNNLLFDFATPHGRRWWDKVGRNIPGAEFAEIVDDLLKNAPVDNTLDLLGTWNTD